MKDDWHNQEFANKWDYQTEKGNPTRPEQLDILVSIIADNYKPGKFILDIGFGSGQVEELIFSKLPEAKIVGVDSSKAMLDLAEKRLVKFGDKYIIVEKDITQFETTDLPEGDYQFTFSVQTFHELPDEDKLAAFGKVYELLEEGGAFILIDRVKVNFDKFADVYGSLWKRLEKSAEFKSRKTFPEFAERFKSKEDYASSLERNITLLKQAGFNATCLHLHLNRAVFVAKK